MQSLKVRGALQTSDQGVKRFKELAALHAVLLDVPNI